MADQQAAKPKKRSRERTSFTSYQKAELEALFNLTQFPDYVTQELLASKIHLQYTVVQVWFKNRRVKWRKSIQKEQEAGLPALAPAAKRKRALEHRHLVNSRPILPRLSHPPEAGPGNPDGASQQCDPELDKLVATVPALSTVPYDISQVMEAYGCLEEEESSNTFTCLYQYLSPSDS
ncbi:arginine-fifty homeobox-like [Canis lupus baileyi]|uniref:arginine-fifty homeobox-like n=1 Tax=Canis lupus dingo TaxID=286419 RepID=UPI0020C2EB38|nr:arginine-fifty homeobox-like [Canis lupus dingo]